MPQPGTAQRLEGLTVWLMWRLQVQKSGTHKSLVTNHTIDINSSDRAGIRWYELRRTGGGAWTLFQEGTFAPDEGAPGPADDPHRWMGSIAMNKDGSIALGYSASNSTLFPSIRYASRVATDPAGQLPLPEVTLTAGAGSQTGTLRWGNYSSMDVDPVDDCTFWYTTEYHIRRRRLPVGERESRPLHSHPASRRPLRRPRRLSNQAGLFTGGLLTDSGLPLSSGLEVGFRYRRVRFVPNFSWEFETGLTSTATAVDDGLLARLQGHLVLHPVPPASPVQPFLLGGLGFAHYNGLTVSDSGVLVTFGGGADFHWTPRVGFRVDLRGLSLHDVVAAGWTTSGQILFGASFSF